MTIHAKNITFLYVLTFCCLFGAATEGGAQQARMNTLFMQHLLMFNPAAAGYDNTQALHLSARQQWIGLSGAPSTQTLSFNSPFLKSRLGMGILLDNSRIGITETQTAIYSLSYSVVKTPRFSIRAGLNASARRLSLRFNAPDQTIIAARDPAIPPLLNTQILYNFGAGLLLAYRESWVSFSVPFVIQNSFGFHPNIAITAIEERHFYMAAGLSIPINDDFFYKPSLMLMSVSSATNPTIPWVASLNTSFEYQENIILGVSYRFSPTTLTAKGESFSVTTSYKLSKKLCLSMSYDIPLAPILGENHFGSAEFCLRYHFRLPHIELSNPRFRQ
jgi:type IX secretion system PorP/SprF family membrane protein